jgi:hypothetical protein
MANTTVSNPLLERAIEACLQCLHWCSACVDEGLNDPSKMAASIRLCHECGPVCGVCASMLSSNSRFAHELCAVCADIAKPVLQSAENTNMSRRCGNLRRPAPAVLRHAGRLLKLGPFERPHRTGIWNASTQRQAVPKGPLGATVEGDSQYSELLAGVT